MLGIPSDMCGNTQCYFPGDACRRHIRIKSFRGATYTFRYVRAVYQRTLFPLFSSAAICNSWDRRARIFKWPTSRFKLIASFSSWLPLEDSNESSRNKISTQDLSKIVRFQDVSSLIRELRSRPRIQIAIKGKDEIPVVNYPPGNVLRVLFSLFLHHDITAEWFITEFVQYSSTHPLFSRYHFQSLWVSNAWVTVPVSTLLSFPFLSSTGLPFTPTIPSVN